MDINMSTNIELNQKIIATPQLQQFVKILQMSHQQLNRFIEQQSLENPILEIESNYEDLRYEEKLKKKMEWLESIDEENRIYYGTNLEETNDYEYTIASHEQESLEYHLLSQLDILPLRDMDYQICQYIIQSLNEHGYLESKIEDIAKIFKTTHRKINKCLKIVQGLEPSGIGARNVAECLSIQLRSQGIQDKYAYLLTNHFLDELGKNKLDTIAKKMGVTLQKVKELYIVIKSLNPYPGNAFNTHAQIRYMKPDIFIVKFKDYYEVLLNDFSYPKLHISNYYKNILNNINDYETKTYISNKIEQASWLINCINQRNTTLMNVTKTIIAFQKKFFDMGPGHLSPMILKDAAKKLLVHESTVSRAIHDKYLQCSWGIFEFKYFFTSGYGADSHSEMTSKNIKLVLQEIIENEDKKQPYSDQKLVEVLKQEGFIIARRTVAKYREAMNIPASTMRKEF